MSSETSTEVSTEVSGEVSGAEVAADVEVEVEVEVETNVAESNVAVATDDAVADTAAVADIIAPDADVAELSTPAPRRKRGFPWRWVGAVVTMLAVGAGCAFAVMAPQRTELPGLKTASDGRYDFAPLVLPALAPGQSDPTSSANPGQQHLSDIRKLLLSPPKGATIDHSLPGGSGWVSESATLALLDDSAAAEQFATDGWRHTAGVAWKTPDGAETKIWLIQFIDNSAAGDAGTIFNPFAGAEQLPAPTMNLVENTSAFYKRVVKGSTTTWYSDTQIGDIEALIEFTAPTSIGITPLQQELDLQVELLQ
jgi:hypothetical protein